jgi:hypothetical protein
VELLSLSLLGNKNSSSLKAILTSPSAVPHAAKHVSLNVTEMVVTATDLSVKCSRQYVPSVVKTPKYRSSLVKAGQYIAAIATIKPG